MNTTIYTVVTGGTDQVIRLWRIYSLRDLKSTGSSRLIPNGPLVGNLCLQISSKKQINLSKTFQQEHLCGNSTIIGTPTMNAECVLSFKAHGSSVTCVRLGYSYHHFRLIRDFI